MKTQLKKIFGDGTGGNLDEGSCEEVKMEPIYESSEAEGTYYGGGYQ